MKTLEEIALQVAEGMPDGFLWTEGCGWETGIIQSEVIDFARRLVAALGAQEPVAEISDCGIPFFFREVESGVKLYAAPYIKEGYQPDTNCTCDEHGACAYCWNGKKHDAAPECGK